MPDQPTPPPAPATSAPSRRLHRLITDPHNPTQPRIWPTYHLPPQTLHILQALVTAANTPITIHHINFRTLTTSTTTLTPQPSPSSSPPPGSSS